MLWLCCLSLLPRLATTFMYKTFSPIFIFCLVAVLVVAVVVVVALVLLNVFAVVRCDFAVVVDRNFNGVALYVKLCGRQR